MDLISLAFYAVVCGVLSMFAARLGGLMPRLGISAAVRLVAATLLPLPKGALPRY
jgi:hypothetical protein